MKHSLIMCCLIYAASGAWAGEETAAQNEQSAIAACIAYCRAQDIYRRTDFDRDGVLEYAQTLNGGRKPAPPVDPASLPKPTSDEKKMIGDLIAKLGADQYEVRETAFVSLEAFGAKALEQLNKSAATDSDPEVMQRAGKLSARIMQNIAPKLNTDEMYGLFTSGREGFVEGDIRLIEKDFAAAECPAGKDFKDVPAKDGYLFRILTRQGPSAVGGARNYISQDGRGNKNMTQGYALLAFPKEYGASGKKIFVINSQSMVFQRDFGSREASDAFAKECTEFNPGAGWTSP